MTKHFKALGLFIWRNLDASLVIGVGAVACALELFGHPPEHVIDAAILGLLAVTAVVLLRIRRRRGELDEVIQVARDAVSERPYQMVSTLTEWDLQDRDRATIRVAQQLRFIHNMVSTIDHFSEGAGTIESYDARWRRTKDQSWMPAKKIHKMPIPGGEKVIYSFEEENCRGDMLEWEIQREAHGRFPEAHEHVSLEAIANSDHPRQMRVIWPEDAPPKSVELRYEGKPGRSLNPKRKKNRMEVVESIPQLPIGDVVEIRWFW
jgi:hypothetical protein